MDWRRNKAVGVVAAVLAVLAIALFVHNITKENPNASVFICENTGKTFRVDISPGNEDALPYLIPADQGAPCKFDDLNDAYLALKDGETGEWRRLTADEINPPRD